MACAAEVNAECNLELARVPTIEVTKAAPVHEYRCVFYRTQLVDKRAVCGHPFDHTYVDAIICSLVMNRNGDRQRIREQMNIGQVLEPHKPVGPD